MNFSQFGAIANYIINTVQIEVTIFMDIKVLL